MLRAALLAGLVVAPVCSIAMFVPPLLRLRTGGLWAASRRFATALLGTAVLCAAVVGVLRWASYTWSEAIAAAAAFAVFSLIWLPATRRWSGRAHLCWASCVFLYLAYLCFIVDWTLHSGLGAAGTTGGVVLWALEVVAGVLAGAYLWELCDALGTEHWRRRVGPATQSPEIPRNYLPFVSLHVPAHNEPPDMVIDTLRALRSLDYPNFQIVAIDDNTEDPSLWQPVAAWCHENGVTFHHLSNWPGYKSGALNYALQHLTDPRTEVIGVVDSDYQIDPGFLRNCAPLFADPNVAFIQAPQDYRDWNQDPYYRRLYYSYKYFFAVSQPARNERDAAIFAGTMGLIRRDTLQALGGWDEWCITEDAELSLRLLRAGYSGLHVDETWGRGVMPLTFEALKSQRYRWCFGGIQILRMHWRSLIRGKRERGNHLSLGQRWGYLAGGLQWYGDLLGIVFYAFLLAGAVNLGSGGGQLFRKLTVFLVATVPVLVVLGLIRAIALLRRGTGASWRDAIGAFFIWQSTSVVVARASVQGLFARKAAFLRTPKTFDEAGWWQVIKANWGESLLAVMGLAGIVVALVHITTLTGPLLAALLLIPVLGFASAPINSFAAQHAALPPQLRERRRSESRRQAAVVTGAVAGGGVAVAAGVAAIVALMAAPSPGPVHPPQLIGKPPASKSHSPKPSPSKSAPTPSNSRSSSPGPTSSSAPSPTASTSPTPTPSSTAPSSPSASTSSSPTPSPSTS